MNFGSSTVGQGCSNKVANLVCKLFGVTTWAWQFLGSLGKLSISSGRERMTSRNKNNP